MVGGLSALAEAFTADILYSSGSAEAIIDSFNESIIKNIRFLGSGAGSIVATVMALGHGKGGLSRVSELVSRWDDAHRKK